MLASLPIVLCLTLGAVPDGPSLRLVELTGDGLPDKLLVAANGALSVKVNQGAGRFLTVQQSLPATRVNDVLVTDLDGDGHADLYLVAAGDNRALLGDGTGRLVEATDALGLGDGGWGLSAERVDLDGVAPPDLVLHDERGDVIFWARDGVFARDPDSTPDPRLTDGAAGQQAAFGVEPGRLARLMRHLSLVDLPDGAGGLARTLRISGANLQIVNGLRATNGHPDDPYSVDEAVTVTNGLGNLIIGYGEPRQFGPWDRTGSHNLVVGRQHAYPSYGGFVAGEANRVEAPGATVAGGIDGTARGLRSSVLGGQQCVADGEVSAVLGGGYNCASGMLATCAGGAYNLAPGFYATVSGGEMNVASGIISSVTGGSQNEASGVGACLVGGFLNEGSGQGAVVVAGEVNLASGENAVVVGGVQNVAGPDGLGSEGRWTSVLGGSGNQATGDASAVAGGGSFDPQAGNRATGVLSAVSGGRGNQASGTTSTVGGGATRAAAGDDDWAAGGLLEDA